MSSAQVPFGVKGRRHCSQRRDEMPKNSRSEQCDQFGRNFAIWAKKIVLGYFLEELIYFLVNHFWAKFYLLWANFFQVHLQLGQFFQRLGQKQFKPSGHTGSELPKAGKAGKPPKRFRVRYFILNIHLEEKSRLASSHYRVMI